jgi:hypothetical protein
MRDLSKQLEGGYDSTHNAFTEITLVLRDIFFHPFNAKHFINNLGSAMSHIL